MNTIVFYIITIYLSIHPRQQKFLTLSLNFTPKDSRPQSLLTAQGGQHGIPSVWLRLELCDNQEFNEEEEEEGNRINNNNNNNYDNNRHFTLSNMYEEHPSSENQVPKKLEERVCRSPRLLMVTKIPDFYNILSNKVGTADP